MGLKETTLSKYIRSIKASPRPLIANKHLITTSLLFALGGIPLCWDQGSSATIPSLPGFQHAFGLTSATNPKQIADFVSLVYVGAGVGSALTYFINDRWGRLWAMRLYAAIWILGQLIAVASSGNLSVMYVGRIVAGLGIGPLTVIGPIALTEIAPAETRGLITSWFTVVLLLSLTVAAFVVLGCFSLVPSNLQWRIPFFAPTIVMAIVIGLSFFVQESPRWLFLVGREQEGTDTLVKLRGLPLDHPRIQSELQEIRRSIAKEQAVYGDASTCSFKGLRAVSRETFLVPANLRRTQQACLSYVFAQLSGANSITTYLIPVLSMIGVQGGTTKSLTYAALYSLAKFFYTLIASFFFVDALGRRNSLFIGIIVQMLSHVYIGVFIKFNQEGTVPQAAGQGALAAIFLHAFGFAVGLLILPYIFVSELWPNQLRSFGAAFTQCFHWLFFFGVNKGMPSLLESTNRWGAFLFFAGWCLMALIYVFFVVPETAGVDLEKIDSLFEGPWWNQYKRTKTMARSPDVIESVDSRSESAEIHDSTYNKV